MSLCEIDVVELANPFRSPNPTLLSKGSALIGEFPNLGEGFLIELSRAHKALKKEMEVSQRVKQVEL